MSDPETETVKPSRGPFRIVMCVVCITVVIIILFYDNSWFSESPAVTVIKTAITGSDQVTQSSEPDQMTQSELHLTPPPQAWAHKQLNKALQMRNATYTPPAVWSCRRPRHTYYFTKIQTIFTGIPKSGCSNWIEALLRAEGALQVDLDPTKVRLVHSKYSNPFRLSKHDLRDRATEQSRAGKVFTFAVVRNPWTRLVSGFRDKLSSEVTQGGSFLGLARQISNRMSALDGTKPGNHPTFNQYLRWMVNHSAANDHFDLQYRTLCLPHATYDYMVPLEYSSVMNNEIWGKIHSNSEVKLLQSYDKSSDPRLSTSTLDAKEWLSNQDQVLIDQLYRIFEVDFTLMNYSNFSDPNFPLPIVPDDQLHS